MWGEWKEINKGVHAFFLGGVKTNHRATAVIFSEKDVYAYSKNFNRHINNGLLKSKTLEAAKKEVEDIIQEQDDNSEDYITLYYDLEYYILVFNDREVVIDNKHIQACPPERFRDGRVKELKKINGVTEIWQCHGSILVEIIKILVYRENDKISTIYDAIDRTGQMIWNKYEENDYMAWEKLNNSEKCRRLSGMYKAIRHNTNIQHDEYFLKIPGCIEEYRKTRKPEPLEIARSYFRILSEKYDLTLFTLLR